MLAAGLVDIIFGEPKTGLHPIALWGRAMGWADLAVRRLVSSSAGLRISGGLVAVSFIAAAYLSTRWLIFYVSSRSAWGGFVAQGLIFWLTISIGELVIIAGRVNKLLREGRLEDSRSLLKSLVGRDTAGLQPAQVRAGAIESIAENLVDAGVAPIFYAVIGGAPLAFAYRIANTLDSMFGYRSPEYIDFGRVSARIDDVLSWVPARVAVLMISLAAYLAGLGFRKSWQGAAKQGMNHPSPNSGLPMAALASALDIRLGGENRYGGSPRTCGEFGSGLEPIDEATIVRAGSLIRVSMLASLLIGGTLALGIGGIRWLIG